jgi:hypothetical protein
MSIAVEDAVTEHAHILEEQDLRRIDAYWRAANYLSVGQISIFWTILCCERRCDLSISSRVYLGIGVPALASTSSTCTSIESLSPGI